MNEVISTSRLKQLIAAACQSEPAFVNVFIDDMIRLIIETVMQGEDVVIDGLGTFRLVTIGGGSYTRIVYFADERMKSGVNAPFAQFEPVILKEGVVSAPLQKESAAEEPNPQHLVNTTDAEAEASDDVVIKEESEMKKNPDPAAGDSRQAAEEAEAKKYREEMAEVESPVEVSDGNGDMTQRVDAVVDQAVADETGKSCTPSGCPASENLTSKRYGVWIVIILLAICIIGTLVYFVVRVDESKKGPTPTEQTAPPVGQITPEVAIPDDSTSTPPAVDMVQAQPAPTASTEENSAERPDSLVEVAKKPASQNAQFPLQVTLKRGERLTLLALRYYGSKFFWVYIYEANKKRYPDPEEIPAGASLVIPSPETYGIDPDNPYSVEKAKEKAARILSY